MKLWILRPIEGEGDWSDEYDVARSFVVRARSEKDARKLVQPFAGDEGSRVWTHPKKSTCTELKVTGKKEVIIRDFHAG